MAEPPPEDAPGALSPSPDLFFEDLTVGQRFQAPPVTVTEAEIIAFARQFDPQYYHVDPQAARASAFGGLVASGFHTLNISFRQFFGLNLWERAIIGSPGMRDVSWTRPVRPGDVLTAAAEVIETRPSASKPDRGLVTMRHETLNQAGELVLNVDCLHMLRLRESAA